MIKVNMGTQEAWASGIGNLMKAISEDGKDYISYMVESYCAGMEKGYSLSGKLQVKYNDLIPDSFYQDPPEEGSNPLVAANAVQNDILLATRYLNKMKNAQKRGIKFSLTLSNFRSIMQRKTCYYTGIRMTTSNEKHYPTIERIDSSKGYEKGNVVLCCNFINSLKNMLFENEDSGYFCDIKHIQKFLNKM